MMRRELSSDSTAIFKFAVPAGLISVAAFVCFIFVWLIITGQGFHLGLMLFVYFMTFIVGALCHSLMPLKKVGLDGYSGYLYVSNYFREVAVPVSEIADAEEEYLSRGLRAIKLSLKRPTPFGRKIKFLPYREASGWWNPREHSLVGELKRLAQGREPGE